METNRFYQVVTGTATTCIFNASVNGNIPVHLNSKGQGGNGITVSASDGTLSITANYPGLGPAQVVEYANTIENNTDVRSYVTNWPATYDIGNWPSTYTVTGTVSLSAETISSLATAIASAIGT